MCERVSRSDIEADWATAGICNRVQLSIHASLGLAPLGTLLRNALLGEGSAAYSPLF